MIQCHYQLKKRKRNKNLWNFLTTYNDFVLNKLQCTVHTRKYYNFFIDNIFYYLHIIQTDYFIYCYFHQCMKRRLSIRYLLFGLDCETFVLKYSARQGYTERRRQKTLVI